MKERTQLTLQVIICAIFLGALGYGVYLSSQHTPAQTGAIGEESHITLNPDALAAEAAIVYDPSSGRILFAKNDEEQLPLASLTKLMTADAALSMIATSSIITVNPQATEQINDLGDYNIWAGQEWRAGDLIRYGLLSSANNAMAAVAESVGTTTLLNKMNANARALGLAQSYFLDPTGLDLTASTSGAYGSARDMALLATALYETHPAVFEDTLLSGKTFNSGDGTLRGKATALPLLNIPGLIGAKTGYTDLAGGNLVTMFDAGLDHPLVAVVLHSTEKGRFDDIRTLIDAARAAQH